MRREVLPAVAGEGHVHEVLLLAQAPERRDERRVVVRPTEAVQKSNQMGAINERDLVAAKFCEKLRLKSDILVLKHDSRTIRYFWVVTKVFIACFLFQPVWAPACRCLTRLA